MKRKLAVLILMASVHVISRADEPADVVRAEAADSISVTMLDEFVVEGKSALVGKEGILFRPSKEEVKHSANAYSLIQNMSIPFLKSTGYSIESTLGAKPEVYIDYIKATEDDLASLQPKNVERVEYLITPSDIRFDGALVVVHFLMRKIDHGGYVKADMTQNILDVNGHYGLYGKYTSGKWMFDFNSKFGFSRKKSHTVTEETFSGFKEVDESADEQISRITESEGKDKRHYVSAAFRALYKKPGVSVTNNLKMYYMRSPENRLAGTVAYFPDLFASGNSFTTMSSEEISPGWSGNLYIGLNSYLSVGISGGVDYTHFVSNKLFDIAGVSDYINDLKYDQYSEYMSVSGSYMPNNNNSISLSLTGLLTQSDVLYSGSVYDNPNQETDIQKCKASLSWNHWRNNGLSVSLSADLNYDHTSINEFGYAKWRPVAMATVNYPINGSQNLQFDAYYLPNQPTISGQYDVLQQINDLEWTIGSKDDRKFGHKYSFGVAYVNLLSNVVSLSASSYYDKETGITSWSWMPIDAYKVIRSSAFNGVFESFYVNANSTVKLFDAKLRLQPGVAYSFKQYSGTNDFIYRDLAWNVSASYYHKAFSFNAYYNSGSYQTHYNSTFKNPDTYGFSVSYGYKNLYLYLNVANMFRDEAYIRMETNANNYNSVTYSRGLTTVNPNRGISIVAVYSLDFGKQVQKWNTIQARKDDSF